MKNSQELFSACNPVVTKPKPKVELPKEDAAAAEQNGPVNGQEQSQKDAAGEGVTENADPASETTENKPNMDLD